MKYLNSNIVQAAWNCYQLLSNYYPRVPREQNRNENYRQLFADLLHNFQRVSVKMSLKIHFMQPHLDFFSENFGNMSAEHGEPRHQDFKQNYKGYHGAKLC